MPLPLLTLWIMITLSPEPQTYSLPDMLVRVENLWQYKGLVQIDITICLTLIYSSSCRTAYCMLPAFNYCFINLRYSLPDTVIIST